MFEDEATERQGTRMLAAGGRAAVHGERADESGRWTQRSMRTAEVIRHQSPRHTARNHGPDYESVGSDAHRRSVVASASLGTYAGVDNNATWSSLGTYAGVENNASSPRTGGVRGELAAFSTNSASTGSSLAMALNVHIGLQACVRVF
jgi:hypothetical protein